VTAPHREQIRGLKFMPENGAAPCLLPPRRDDSARLSPGRRVRQDRPSALCPLFYCSMSAFSLPPACSHHAGRRSERAALAEQPGENGAAVLLRQHLRYTSRRGPHLTVVAPLRGGGSDFFGYASPFSKRVSLAGCRIERLPAFLDPEMHQKHPPSPMPPPNPRSRVTRATKRLKMTKRRFSGSGDRRVLC